MLVKDVKIGLIVRDIKFKTLYRILDIPIIISMKHYTEHRAVYYKENITNKTYVDTIATFADRFEIVLSIEHTDNLKNFTL